MQLTRQHVVDIFRKVGLPEMADAAQRELPDPVERDQVAAWAVPYGISIDDLTGLMGGSP